MKTNTDYFMYNVKSKGHFVLTSGVHTDTYYDCDNYMASIDHLYDLALDLVDEIKLKKLNPRIIVSPAMGGMIIGSAVAINLHSSTTFIYTEKDNYYDGGKLIKNQKIKRNFTLKGSSINHLPYLVVEDVLTTGETTRLTIEAMRREGFNNLIGIVCIINRTNKDDLIIKINEKIFNFPIISLFKENVKYYLQKDCPLCQI